jgi:NADH dehydrogenase
MSNMTQTVMIFGGTGFLGSYVVSELARAGFRLNIITRDVIAAAHLKTQGDVGQINLQYGDIYKPVTYEKLLANTDIIVNLVGVLFEKGNQNFDNLHHLAPSWLAELASENEIKRFIHVSALGVERAKTSKYAQSKLQGENAILQAFPNATILRPSVIFGVEDNFYNQFAKMIDWFHAAPLIAGGKTKFQPSYVIDVAKAVAKICTSSDYNGKIYELGGGEIISFKQILQFIKQMRHSKALLVPLPACCAKMIGFANEFLPKPLITRDQVELLRYDNVVSDGALGYKELGIAPHSPSSIVPQYLQTLHGLT